MKSSKKKTGYALRNYKGVKSSTLSKSDFKQIKNRNIILILAAPHRIGKLGYTVKTADAEFYFNAKANADALRKNEKGYYSPAFDDLDLLDSQLLLYWKSMVKIKLGGLGKAGKKNACKTNVKNTLDDALAYVNKLARKNPTKSEEIITGALFKTYKKRSVFKQLLRAKVGLSTGEILLYTIAVKINGKYVRAMYHWRYSIDGGATWIKIEMTQKAKTIVKEMATGISTLFSIRSKTNKSGMSAWCTPVEIFPE